jgi:hypothetical protein
MLLTIAIAIAAICGYGLGIRTSTKYHRQIEAELIAQTRDQVCREIFEIAKEARAKQQAAQ